MISCRYYCRKSAQIQDVAGTEVGGVKGNGSVKVTGINALAGGRQRLKGYSVEKAGLRDRA